jgi:hypothetical protein
MSWYTASNSTNHIAEQLIYGEWLYYNYIYSAPKSTDVTFQNLEGKFWLVDVAEFSMQLG